MESKELFLWPKFSISLGESGISRRKLKNPGPFEFFEPKTENGFGIQVQNIKYDILNYAIFYFI